MIFSRVRSLALVVLTGRPDPWPLMDYLAERGLEDRRRIDVLEARVSELYVSSVEDLGSRDA